MNSNKLSQKPWFNGAVVACIGVTLFVLLWHFPAVLRVVGGFLSSFRSVVLGAVIAYVLSPLANFFDQKVFGKMKPGMGRWGLSVGLCVITALLALMLLLGTLIPQLVASVATLVENFDTYAASLVRMVKGSPLEALISAEELENLSGNALKSISEFLGNNADKVLSAAADSGKGILSTVIASIVAVYLLIGKDGVRKGWWQFTQLVFSEKAANNILDFVHRCNKILMSYLGQSLLESVIVGGANAIFMVVCGMQYVGLISVIVGVTNLIPNFGPIIGGVIGGFILLLVNPLHALMFVAFCVVLQFVDGYILKPKLFSGSLGVSGLLILVSGIVLGNLFGVLGMLLSIPAAAIMSFIYYDYFLKRRIERRGK